MKKITLALSSSLLTLALPAASENVLKFSYWDDAKPPFVIEQDGAVHSGIIKDLAERIAASAGVAAKFVKLPVLRIESQLQSGSIDLDCMTSPIWKASPGAYHWSPVLFEGADRFLVRPEFASNLHSFDDLKGKTLGIYNGYVYHPDIMHLIDSGAVSTIKVHGIDHGIKLLQLKRLDALIDFGILLKYQLREQGLKEQLVLAELPADEYKLHCAYSKKSNLAPRALDMIFESMIRSGELETILKRYQ